MLGRKPGVSVPTGAPERGAGFLFRLGRCHLGIPVGGSFRLAFGGAQSFLHLSPRRCTLGSRLFACRLQLRVAALWAGWPLGPGLRLRIFHRMLLPLQTGASHCSFQAVQCGSRNSVIGRLLQAGDRTVQLQCPRLTSAKPSPARYQPSFAIFR